MKKKTKKQPDSLQSPLAKKYALEEIKGGSDFWKGLAKAYDKKSPPPQLSLPVAPEVPGQANQKELNKLGYSVEEGESSLKINSTQRENKNAPIETYHDHRMAMAFAPLCSAIEAIDIIDPSVVSKSYPTYWDELKKQGYSCV